MAFIEVERLIVSSSWKMQNPHKHSHYEIYYLQEGLREHIIDGRLYYAASHSFVLIPPNTPHQTEGTPFNRLNINFDAAYVSVLPQDVLAHCFESTIIPIAPEDLPHVFDRFYRGSRRAKDDGNHLGLGLVIAKRIAELHGGELRVSSELNGGTRFAFDLPVRAVEASIGALETGYLNETKGDGDPAA